MIRGKKFYERYVTPTRQTIQEFMDTPQQRTIKIGDATVGLIGLERAFQQLRTQGKLQDTEAAEYLLAAIRKHNYIPPGTEESYKHALLLAFKNQLAGSAHDNRLTIRILGRPCVSCNKLKTMVIDILQEMGVAADIEDIHDLDEIWRFGVTKTPALIINGQVKSAGIQPPRFQVEQWLREVVEEEDSRFRNPD
jgi:hypothetical protein